MILDFYKVFPAVAVRTTTLCLSAEASCRCRFASQSRTRGIHPAKHPPSQTQVLLAHRQRSRLSSFMFLEMWS